MNQAEEACVLVHFNRRVVAKPKYKQTGEVGEVLNFLCVYLCRMQMINAWLGERLVRLHPEPRPITACMRPVIICMTCKGNQAGRSPLHLCMKDFLLSLVSVTEHIVDVKPGVCVSQKLESKQAYGVEVVLLTAVTNELCGWTCGLLKSCKSTKLLTVRPNFLM